MSWPRPKTVLALLTTLCALTFPATPVLATPVYNVTDLGVLPGDSESFAYDINNAGQVVGSDFLYSNGQLTRLSTAFEPFWDINDHGQYVKGDQSAINNAGQIAGEDPVTDQAYLLTNGVRTYFGAYKRPLGINNSGEVVGSTMVSYVGPRPFLFSNGQMQILPGGSTFGEAWAINDAGQVVGNNAMHAFLYSNGKMIDLGVLGDPRSQLSSNALSINSSGLIVGWSRIDTYNDHAFLYTGGQMLDLNNLLAKGLPWTLTAAVGINDSGQIVANGQLGGVTHAFLLTPAPAAVPEPSTLAIAILSIASLSLVRWRKGGLASATC
jgi:probable HAF family extracellular repeat protein